MRFTGFADINRNVRAFVIADGFYYSGYSVVNAFLAVLITSSIAPGRTDLVGLAISYYLFARAAVEIPLSRLTRRLPLAVRPRFIAAGYILYGISLFLLGQSHAIWHVLAAQTALAVLDAVVYPVKWTTFTRVLDRREQEAAWGLEDISCILLTAFFTAIAGFVSARYGLDKAFLVFSLLLVVSGLMFLRVRSDGSGNIEAILNAKQKEVLAGLVGKLNAAGIRYQVSGGLGAIVHGSDRPLYDIDIDVADEDIGRVREMFAGCITRPYGRFEDDRFDIMMMTLDLDGVPVDVCSAKGCRLRGPDTDWTDMPPTLDESHCITFRGERVPVALKEDMIEYKKVLSRDVDLIDIDKMSC